MHQAVTTSASASVSASARVPRYTASTRVRTARPQFEPHEAAAAAAIAAALVAAATTHNKRVHGTKPSTAPRCRMDGGERPPPTNGDGPGGGADGWKRAPGDGEPAPRHEIFGALRWSAVVHVRCALRAWVVASTCANSASAHRFRSARLQVVQAGAASGSTLALGLRGTRRRCHPRPLPQAMRTCLLLCSSLHCCR